MSLTPIDLQRYKDWTIEQLYYLLFPYIKEDFMGRRDCEMVHTTGNMIPMVGTETGTIQHVSASGGSDTYVSSLEETYRSRAEDGTSTITQAQETGEFNG